MNAPSVTPAEPGIDIRKLKADTTILLEAEPYLYEIKVMHPTQSVVEISSSDPRLRAATVGQVLHSIHWSSPGSPIPAWIGRGLALEIRFRNGTYRTQPIVSARVSGKGWAYDVF